MTMLRSATIALALLAVPASPLLAQTKPRAVAVLAPPRVEVHRGSRRVRDARPDRFARGGPFAGYGYSTGLTDARGIGATSALEIEGNRLDHRMSRFGGVDRFGVRQVDGDRSRSPRYRMSRYAPPRGWRGGYRAFGVGSRLDAALYDDAYRIASPDAFRLPPDYGAYRWVRFYNDAILVDLDVGHVVAVVPALFW